MSDIKKDVHFIKALDQFIKDNNLDYLDQSEAKNAAFAFGVGYESAKQDSGWQPIKTAPKDGSLIIVFRPTAGFNYIPKIGEDYWKDFGTFQTWARSNTSHLPTHWRPMPQPPREQS